MPDCCKTCRFWMPSPRSGDANEDEAGNEVPPFKPFGECRREPPRISEFMASMCFARPVYNGHLEEDDGADYAARHSATIRPVTWWEDWCGHYEPGAPAARKRLVGAA